MQVLFIICPLVFVGGVLDAIVGSGALITLPAYMIAGLPAHTAYGTGKLASFLGSLSASIRYIRNGSYDRKLIPTFAIMNMIGSYAGSNFTLYLSELFFKYILIAILPILIVFLVIRGDVLTRMDQVNASPPLTNDKLLLYSIVFGLLLGFYGGFVGVGVMSFQILVFINVFKTNAINAAGNGKIINCLVNLVAATTFLFSGNIVFWIAIPAALSSILGNYVGAGLTMSRGSKIMKPLFVLVFVVLFVRLVAETFFSG